MRLGPDTGLAGAAMLLVEDVGADACAKTFVSVALSTEFVFMAAVSSVFVCGGCSTSAGGSAKEKRAVASENRSGGGPIWVK